MPDLPRTESHCAHGRPFYGPSVACLECEILWHEEMLRFAKQRVEHHERLLELATGLRDYMKANHAPQAGRQQ